MNFQDLPLSDEIQERLASLNFVEPTPIQAKAIPHIMEGKDVIGKAETGTGKTLAFSLPILDRLDPDRGSIQALILTPTRELAHQVQEALSEFETSRDFHVVSIVGGESQTDQLLELRKGCHVVVGTPGRVLDMAGMGYLAFEWLEYLVLDEADRMLDMGFIDQISAILECTPPERQTLLFSATFPPELQRIAKKHMREPEYVETSQGLRTATTIDQKYVRVRDPDKGKLLRQLLDISKGMGTIVFLNRKRDTHILGKDLWGRGYDAVTLHGDMEQSVRNKVLEDFRNGVFDILVATDVAQRGLDVTRVERVINYQVPNNPEDYVHRIGRTGRAGRKGAVLTLVDCYEWNDFKPILSRVGDALGELPLPPSVRTWSMDEAGKRPPPRSGFGGRGGRGGSGGRGRGRPGGGRGMSKGRSGGRPRSRSR